MSLATTLGAPIAEALAQLGTGDVAATEDAWRQGSTTVETLAQDQATATAALAAGWEGATADTALAQARDAQHGAATLAEQAGTVAAAVAASGAAVAAARRQVQAVLDAFTAFADQHEAAAAVPGTPGARAQQVVAARAAADATDAAHALETARAVLVAQAAALGALPEVPIAAAGLAVDGAGVAPAAVTSQSVATAGGTTGVTTAPAPSALHHGGGGAGGGGGSADGGSGGAPSGGGSGGAPSGPTLHPAAPVQPGSGVDVNLPDGSTVQAPDAQAAAAVRNALTQLGVPYVWGASNPGVGMDCSGLTSWAYGEAGITLARHSAAQAVGASVTPDALLPGDLVVWNGHVAMVCGPGVMVEAGDPVEISPVRTSNQGDAFLGFYRPTG